MKQHTLRAIILFLHLTNKQKTTLSYWLACAFHRLIVVLKEGQVISPSRFGYLWQKKRCVKCKNTHKTTYNLITELKHSLSGTFDADTVALRSYKKLLLSSASKSGGWLCPCVTRKHSTGSSKYWTARARQPDFVYFAHIKYLQQRYLTIHATSGRLIRYLFAGGVRLRTLVWYTKPSCIKACAAALKDAPMLSLFTITKINWTYYG